MKPPGPPGWGLERGTDTSASVKALFVEKPLSKPRNRTEHRQRPRKRNMVFDFVTWNIRTLYKVGAQLSVISEIEKYKMSVTAIQETRVLGREINEVKKFMVLNSGKTEGKHEYGVAFIVHPSFKGNIIDFKPINERICVLRVRMKFFNVAMINVYATTEDKGPQEKDEFYYQLERVLDTLHANDVKIVLGDLNAKIGREEEFRNTIGRNSLHEISNDNGRRQIEIL